MRIARLGFAKAAGTGHTSETALCVKCPVDDIYHASLVNVLSVKCTPESFVTFVDVYAHNINRFK